MRPSPAPLSIGLAALLLALAPVRAETYSLYRLGLTGGAFTDSAGYEWSTVSALENGIAAGTSEIKITTTTTPGGPGPGTIIGIPGGGLTIGGGTSGGSLTLITLGSGQWLGNVTTGVTTRVGLYDAGFTKSDNGLQKGTLLGLSGGVAAGQAIRYSGTSGAGEASWIANAATGQSYRIGFYDANYTFVDGSQDTHVQYVQGGYAAGYSSIAVGGSGSATWVANSAGVTSRVGLYGVGYTTDSGLQNSTVRGLNGGIVVGESAAYAGETSLGQAGWMTNAATGVTTRLGFTGAAYTRVDGTQLTVVQYLKDGYVSGWSGTSGVGIEQWVAPTTTGVAMRVGLKGGIFTASDGTELTYAELLSNGNIAGQSYFYNGGANYVGHAAWVSSAATDTTRRIGLFDTAPYVGTDGRQYSVSSHLTGSYVAGFSRQYSGNLHSGTAVWVAPVAAGSAVRVGLYDADFTSSNGGQISSVSDLKGEYVAGTSERFLGGNTSRGSRAWIADASTGTTTALGMTDAAHTSGATIQSSNVTFLTATGYLAGSSKVYSTSGEVGATAWIWDANTSVFDPIELSINPTTGAAISSITRLFDNGVAIGYYELFDSLGVSLGLRPFLWTVTDHEVDLTSLVDGGLSAHGWSLLNNALLADPSLDAIIGHGRVPLNATSQAVYVTTPAPEPGTSALLALGALGLTGRRRRK